MSLSFESELRVAAPPSSVFSALADLDQWPRWMPGLVAVERLTPGSGLPAGTKFRETRKMFGREASEVFEVVSSAPPHALTLHVDGTQGSSRSGQYRFEYRLEPDAGATRVHFADLKGGTGVCIIAKPQSS